MGWREVREAYARRGRLGDQKDEDMVGRRLLSGLGLSNPAKNIWDAESAVLGRRGDDNAPFIERALDLASQMLRDCDMVVPIFGEYPVLSCERRLGKMGSKARDILEEDRPGEESPIVHIMRGLYDECLAVYKVKADVLLKLHPPYRVVGYDARHGGTVYPMVVQDLTTFCSQLRTYD